MSDAAYIPLIRDSKDIYYRYKMPKLTAKIEGSGNGIKTVITNMSVVAKALNRPPTYPTKYFGCELGAQVTMDVDRNEFIVNGAHDPEKLLALLYSFIGKFVLCANCKNPETKLEVINKTISQTCQACAYHKTIPNTIHRLTSFIVSHPPTTTSAVVSRNVASKIDKKKSGKSQNGGKKQSKRSPTCSENGSDEATTTKQHDNVNKDEDDDGFGSDDFTEQAYEERMRLLTDGLSSMSMVECANTFFNLLTEKKSLNQLNEIVVQKDLLNKAKDLGIGDKATLVLCEVLFTDQIIEEIKQYKLLLLRFCVDNKKAQKYLLGGLEKLIGDLYKDQLFNKSMSILKEFYDNDILEEDVLVEWGSKASKKYVSKEVSKQIRDKIQPFIKWLKEAEVDESDDDKKNTADNDEDDDDDDDLIEYSHRVNGVKMETIKDNDNADNDDGNGDLNIDEI